MMRLALSLALTIGLAAAAGAQPLTPGGQERLRSFSVESSPSTLERVRDGLEPLHVGRQQVDAGVHRLPAQHPGEPGVVAEQVARVQGPDVTAEEPQGAERGYPEPLGRSPAQRSDGPGRPCSRRSGVHAGTNGRPGAGSVRRRTDHLIFQAFRIVYATARGVLRGARIGRGVYVGPRCTLGLVTLEDDVLLAANVDVLSGSGQHRAGWISTCVPGKRKYKTCT